MPKRIPMAAVILAGGKSSRMGRDKALLPCGSETMLEFLSGLMTSLFDETIVVVENKLKCESLNLKKAVVYEDLFKNQGPLAGLYTGLSYSNHQANAVFTCDMPFVDKEIIQQLVSFWEEEYDVMCLEDPDGRLQPFPGVYARACRHLVRLLLERSEHSLQRLLAVATVKPVVMQKEKIKVLTNMNTIEDYCRVLKEKKEWVR